ncbi:MAG: hypothetical protein ACREC5_03885, partial [Thermoplasmata archaeon]
MPERDPEETAALRAARIEIDVGLAREIDGRLGAAPAERLLSVTDLTEPRIAYHRAIHPVAPSPARAERMSRGQRAHERIERLLAAPGQREVRIVRAGIVGKLDLLSDRPIEIKSTAHVPPADRVVSGRPQYVDQLAMYCALSGREEGRILLVAAPEQEPYRVVAIDCRFGEAAELWRRTEAIAARLRSALRARDPTALPRCGWWGRGCEYELAGICGCTGAEPPGAESPGSALKDWTEDASTARDLELRLNATGEPPGPVPVALYRELLYPRRAFFDRTEPVPAGGGAPEAHPSPGEPGPNLFQRLREALEAGAPGELVREVPPGDVPEEQVLRFRGRLLLLKTSRILRPPSAAELPDRHALFLLELGLRCAASRAEEGWLLVGYDRIAPEAGPVRTYRVFFGETGRWAGILARRRDGLRAALGSGRPEGLATCPEWMFEG